MKRLKRNFLYLLLLAVVLSAGSCRRAVEKAADKIRLLGVEKVERQGLTGAEVVVRIDNGSGYNLTLSSAEIGIHYGSSCVGTVVLCQPVEVTRRSVASVTTRWRIRISDPLALYLLVRKVGAGELDQIALSCRAEGKGGPAPVKFSREKVPLSEFLNTFGLSIQDVEKYLK